MIIAPLIVLTVAWLIREVVSIRRDFVKFKATSETQIAAIQQNCRRHQGWAEKMDGAIQRVDRNVVRLCQKSEIEYEKPS